jgi:pyocin large subunit-like protein
MRRILLTVGLLAFLAVLGANAIQWSSDDGAPEAAPPAISDTRQDSGAAWSSGGVGARENAEHHWQKHGSEFSEFHSATEYENGVLEFVTHPPSGTLTKQRPNGDTLFYDPQSNTFAVATRDGVPRTFFRPDSGRAYWDRQ